METSTQSLTAYQQHLIEWAREDARKKNDWPGTPLSQIPLAGAADMHHLIGLGLLKIVEVESTIRAGRINSYVVAL
jgi:hypothetical protein